MAIAKIIGCFILWLIIVPLCAGVLPTLFVEKKPNHFGTTFLLGWMFMTAVFQLLAVPFVISGNGLSALSRGFMACMGISSITGIVAFMLLYANETYYDDEMKTKVVIKKEDIISYIIFGIILLFQIIMAIFYMTPDGDDSYFITHAQIAVGNDSMYVFDAYTGMIGSPDYRHALAPFSMFIGFLSKRSGLHAAIVAHTVLPIVLIPLVYLAYYKIARELFDEDHSKISIFMILIAGIQILGGASVYTKEAFFLTRIWQGKSLEINLILPEVVYLMLLLTKYSSKKFVSKRRMLGLFLLMFMVNMSAALMSSLGLFLIAVFDIVMYIVIAIRNRKVWIVFCGLASMIPCYVYICFYVLLT